MDLESQASSLGFKRLDSDYWFKTLLLQGRRNELIPLEYIIVLTKERKKSIMIIRQSRAAWELSWRNAFVSGPLSIANISNVSY